MNELATISKLLSAKMAVLEVKELDEIKRIIDQSEALKSYARAQRLSREIQDDVAEYALYATRQMGLISSGMEKGKPGAKQNVLLPDAGNNSKIETLAAAGIDIRRANEAEKLAAIPEAVFAEIVEEKKASGELTKTAVMEAATKASRAARREEKAERKMYTPPVSLPDTCRLFRADIRDSVPVDDESVDFIITDPPYPKEYISLYGYLSKLASRVLKPGGSLLAMCGQSYLPEVMAELQKDMTYYWCLSYLTPGQSPQLWTKRVNTFWKPVLWFVKGEYTGDHVADVVKSPTNDKEHHEWGQSVGGFADIVDKFTYPGQVIYDPFLGGGTTGVAAVKAARAFIGSDIEQDNVDRSKQRIVEVLQNGR